MLLTGTHQPGDHLKVDLFAQDLILSPPCLNFVFPLGFLGLGRSLVGGGGEGVLSCEPETVRHSHMASPGAQLQVGAFLISREKARVSV